MVFMLLPLNVLSLSLRTPLVRPIASALSFSIGISLVTLPALSRGISEPVSQCHACNYGATLATTCHTCAPNAHEGRFKHHYTIAVGTVRLSLAQRARVQSLYHSNPLKYARSVVLQLHQHCNIGGCTPHGDDPNISLKSKWKYYYRGKSHYVLDPQKLKLVGKQFRN